MIKFEEHEGKLFRILDKPVPLTPDAEMPCLVRLVQDDSPMGRYNQNLDKSALHTIEMCIGIDRQYQYILSDSSLHYARYEVIGYFVSKGSKEWALYQMMNGENIRHHKAPSIMYCKWASKIMRDVRCGCVDFMSIDAWLNGADKSGWQIYKEPEPPKSAYQVGDFVVCTYSRSQLPQKNSYERVIEVSGNGIVTKANDGCVTEYDINGNHRDINGWHIERLVRPEEYIICIGCLSGTIKKSCDNAYFSMRHSSPDRDRNYSVIKFSALDKETRELVESLLKAQEEE